MDVHVLVKRSAAAAAADVSAADATEELLATSQVLALPPDAAREVQELFQRMTDEALSFFSCSDEQNVLQQLQHLGARLLGSSSPGALGSTGSSMSHVRHSSTARRTHMAGSTAQASQRCEQLEQPSPAACYAVEHHYVPFVRQWAHVLGGASTHTARLTAAAVPASLPAAADAGAEEQRLATGRCLLNFLLEGEMWSCVVLLLGRMPQLTQHVLDEGLDSPELYCFAGAVDLLVQAGRGASSSSSSGGTPGTASPPSRPPSPSSHGALMQRLQHLLLQQQETTLVQDLDGQGAALVPSVHSLPAWDVGPGSAAAACAARARAAASDGDGASNGGDSVPLVIVPMMRVAGAAASLGGDLREPMQPLSWRMAPSSVSLHEQARAPVVDVRGGEGGAVATTAGACDGAGLLPCPPGAGCSSSRAGCCEAADWDAGPAGPSLPLQVPPRPQPRAQPSHAGTSSAAAPLPPPPPPPLPAPQLPQLLHSCVHGFPDPLLERSYAVFKNHNASGLDSVALLVCGGMICAAGLRLFRPVPAADCFAKLISLLLYGAMFFAPYAVMLCARLSFLRHREPLLAAGRCASALWLIAVAVGAVARPDAWVIAATRTFSMHLQDGFILPCCQQLRPRWYAAVAAAHLASDAFMFGMGMAPGAALAHSAATQAASLLVCVGLDAACRRKFAARYRGAAPLGADSAAGSKAKQA